MVRFRGVYRLSIKKIKIIDYLFHYSKDLLKLTETNIVDLKKSNREFIRFFFFFENCKTFVTKKYFFEYSFVQI